MSKATYTVTGMTCGHCVMSVTEELTELDGPHLVEAMADHAPQIAERIGVSQMQVSRVLRATLHRLREQVPEADQG